MLLVIALFFLRLPESTAGEGTASEPDFIFMDVFPSALDLSGGFSALLKTFSLHNSRCFSNGSFNAFPRVSLKRFSFLWSKLDIILFLSLLLTKPGHFLSFLTSAVNYFWEVSSAVQLNKFPSCHSCVVFVRYGSLFTPHSLSLWFFFFLCHFRSPDCGALPHTSWNLRIFIISLSFSKNQSSLSKKNSFRHLPASFSDSISFSILIFPLYTIVSMEKPPQIRCFETCTPFSHNLDWTSGPGDSNHATTALAN